MRVTKIDQIPNQPHYQLIVFSHINENTGYDDGGDYYRTVTDIFILDEKELKAKILKLDKNNEKYLVQHVDKQCNVKIQASVQF
jgi:hypothetical protein